MNQTVPQPSRLRRQPTVDPTRGRFGVLFVALFASLYPPGQAGGGLRDGDPPEPAAVPPASQPAHSGDDTLTPHDGASETFLGTTTRQRVAVVDFEVRGNPTLPDAGVIIADRVRSGLSPKWFDLIERTQLRKLLDEHDLQSAGLLQPDARRALGRVANVSHLVLGSVTRTHEVVVDARLVEVATGRIVRQAAATVASIDLLDAAADRLAAVLSAADAQYAEIVARRRRQQADALDAEPRITRQGNNLRIRLRVATAGKTELVHVREVRNTMRNLFVDYCHGQLGLNTSKAALIDHCREHEECEDIRTVGAMKEYTYMVPLPD